MQVKGQNWWETPAAGNMDTRAVLGPERQTQLGDPMRWSSSDTTECSPIGVFESEQLLRVACKDPYGRQWSIGGNLIAEPALWGATAPEWRAFLRVTMGMGQHTTTQLFDLRALVSLASPWYGTPLVGTRISKPWFIDGGVLGAQMNAQVVYVLADPPLAGSTTLITAEAFTAPIMAGSGL